jgi:hypothetical protein
VRGRHSTVTLGMGPIENFSARPDRHRESHTMQFMNHPIAQTMNTDGQFTIGMLLLMAITSAAFLMAAH